MDVKTILSDWQKAVNTIAHALNKAGYDGNSPESKALELLAGRCEGTADAKTIAGRLLLRYDIRVAPVDRDKFKHVSIEDNLTEFLAPLLSTGVDVRKLADDLVDTANDQLWKENHSSKGYQRPERLKSRFVEDITASLTDSAGEIKRMRGLLRGALIPSEVFGEDDVCDRCAGWGFRAYPSTSTWLGGIGGQVVTNGVCDVCWGSGQKSRHGANLRDLYAERKSSKNELDALRSELDKVKEDKDGAYTERNRLVAFIASIFPSQQCKTNIEGWDPEWHGCVFIETPAGQLSWHFHDSDAGLFDHVPYGSPVWDGHTTPEKYERVKSLINIRALTDSPAEIERLNQIIAENRTKNWNVINHKKEIIAALRSELDKVKGERSNLREFAESLFDRMWGYSDVDDQDIDTYAKRLGLLVTIPATEEFLQEWGRECTTMDVPAWSDLALAALSETGAKRCENCDVEIEYGDVRVDDADLCKKCADGLVAEQRSETGGEQEGSDG